MALQKMLFPFLTVIYITGFTDATGPVLRISTTQQSHHVLEKEGKKLMLDCQVVQENLNLFDISVNWVKTIGGRSYRINNNRNILLPFLSTKYDIVLIQKPELTEVALNISNVSLEDNGTYVCEASDQHGVIDKVQHEVIVYSDIHQISFTSGNKTTIDDENGMTFVLNDGETVPLVCLSTGGTPRPMVEIYKDADDISAQFNEEVSQKNISGPAGRQTFVYTVRREMPEFKVTEEDDGKVLKCEATIHNVPRQKTTTFSRTTSAKIQVRFGPRFRCENQVVAAEDAENFELECVVHANPPVKPEAMQWHLPKEKLTMKHGEQANNYTAKMTTQEDGTVKAVLTIANVTETSFQLYRLKAENDVSTEVHEIRLIKDNDSGKSGGSGQSTGGDNGYKSGETKSNTDGAASIPNSAATCLVVLVSMAVLRN